MADPLISRFDGAAADHARRRATETSFRLQVAAARACLPPTPGRILDLGCGSGALAEAMGVFDGSLVGADLSPGMLREARRRDLAVVLSKAGRLPFGDGRFDAVLVLGLLEYLPEPERVIREIARVLAPGGVVVLTWPNSRAPARLWMRLFPGRFDQNLARRLPRRRVEEQVRSAGLAAARVRTTNAALLPWPLDALLPGLARVLARACDPFLCCPPFSWLGTQIVLAARKPTG